jgi:uncharacterized protein (TIGR02145 family)
MNDWLYYLIVNNMGRKSGKSYIAALFLFFLVFGCTDDRDVLFINMQPWISYGNMTDQEGNIYKTIQVGSQTWMAENLKTATLTDGTPIPVIREAEPWNTVQGFACCWQDNNPAFRTTYGILYNWHTINTGKLCPAGWHVPSDAEWSTLTDFLGGDNTAGGKLKEAGFKHWNSPNAGATNESGFRALPGGESLSGSGIMFHNLHVSGSWWTTTYNKEWAVSRTMSDDSDGVRRSFCAKQYGLSVRCVMDY